MKITNLDTDIILELIRTEGATTTELAYVVAVIKDEYELRKVDSKIRYRLQRMLKKEMVKKDGTKYSVNEERVFLTEASMHLHDIKVDVPMGMMLVAYPKDETIMMRTISVEQNSSSKKQG